VPYRVPYCGETEPHPTDRQWATRRIRYGHLVVDESSPPRVLTPAEIAALDEERRGCRR
jgi:hypothetical protein